MILEAVIEWEWRVAGLAEGGMLESRCTYT